jgi:hypothetical protein
MIRLPDEIFRNIISIKNELEYYERYQTIFEKHLKYIHMQIRYYMIQCNNTQVSTHLLERIHGITKYNNIIADEVYLYHHDYIAI